MARRPAPHRQIRSRRAPRPVGHAAQATVAAAGSSLYVSAQLPLEMPSGKPTAGPFAKQCGQALANLQAVVLEAGFILDEVVHVRVWLTDLAHLGALDVSYRSFFIGQGLPARDVVQVAALPQGVSVAFGCTAVKVAPTAAPPGAAEMEPDYGDDEGF